MSWVLWDIVIPLLVTFSIGLLTGWLLWRWRRYKVPAQPANDLEEHDRELALTASSATALIEERDQALARAEAAEQRVEELNTQWSSEAMSEVDNLIATDSSAHIQADNTDEEMLAQIAALESQLASEKESKVELEQAFMDLNNRFGALNQEREDTQPHVLAVDQKNAALAEEVATLKQQLDDSQSDLQAQKERVESLEEKQEIETAELTQKLADSESEADGLKLENKQLAEKIETLQESSSDTSVSSSQADNVHHLSSYSRSAENSPGKSTKKSSNSGQAGEHAVLSSAPVNIASDKRVSAASGVNAAASAISSDDAVESLADSKLTDDNSVTEECLDDEESKIEASQEIASSTTDSKERASAKSTATGYNPVGWEVPQRTPGKTQRDNLQKIKGVGPVLEKLLNKTGIYYFEQIAALDVKGIDELDSQLPQFSGRIQRDQWVQQAESLYREKHGESPALEP